MARRCDQPSPAASQPINRRKETRTNTAPPTEGRHVGHKIANRVHLSMRCVGRPAWTQSPVYQRLSRPDHFDDPHMPGECFSVLVHLTRNISRERGNTHDMASALIGGALGPDYHDNLTVQAVAQTKAVGIMPVSTSWVRLLSLSEIRLASR